MHTQYKEPQKFQSLKAIAKWMLTMSIATILGVSFAYAQPVKGGNYERPTQGGGSGGFGFSLDIGMLVKAVQTFMDDEQYSPPDTTNQPPYEAAQIIVSWSAGSTKEAQTLLQSAGSTAQVQVDLTNLDTHIAVLSFANDTDAQSALLKLQSAAQKNPSIIIDRHAIAYLAEDAKPSSTGKQYARELIKAPSKTKLSNAVAIGMIDTEISNSNTLALGKYQTKRIFSDTEKPASTEHGNAVAAIFSATGNGFEGFAQGSNLYVAGVMREVSSGINSSNTLLVAKALDWLAGEKVQIVNLSLASAHDAVLADVIAKSQRKGMVLVAAAGNGGAKAPPAYPAAYNGVIAATAVDANSTLYARANHGSYIAIAAPGVDVWVPAVLSDGKTIKAKYVSGTSFASPFVSAAVAQSVAQQGVATQPVQLQRLCSKALKLKVQTVDYGCGLLQM